MTCCTVNKFVSVRLFFALYVVDAHQDFYMRIAMRISAYADHPHEPHGSATAWPSLFWSLPLSWLNDDPPCSCRDFNWVNIKFWCQKSTKGLPLMRYVQPMPDLGQPSQGQPNWGDCHCFYLWVCDYISQKRIGEIWWITASTRSPPSGKISQCLNWNTIGAEDSNLNLNG